MNICTTSILRRKEIVNVCDGRRMGCASDFEFDPCSGKIISIIVPGDAGVFGIGKRTEIVIPWNKIQCFGEDTILVRIEGEIGLDK